MQLDHVASQVYRTQYAYINKLMLFEIISSIRRNLLPYNTIDKCFIAHFTSINYMLKLCGND